MLLLGEAHPEAPALDMAITAALLRAVAAGAEPAVRLFRPGATMAFGRLDALRPGYAAARSAAAAHGFTPVMRLGGGHAAAYDGGALVLEIVAPVARVAEGIEARFAAGTALLMAALAACDVDAEIGELPREYCPGRWSVHLRDGPKVAGAAQRTIRGASLFTAVVAVSGGDRLRAALVDTYAALDLDWDPRTAGAVDDGATAPTLDGLRAAIEAEVVIRLGAAPGTLDATLLATARAQPDACGGATGD